MNISLEEAKQYCQIDFNEDDTFLQGLIQASYVNLCSITGRTLDSFVEDESLAKLYCMSFIVTIYSDRALTVDKASQKINKTMSNILLLLQTSRG